MHLSIPSIFITDNDGKKTVMVKSGNSRNSEFKEKEVKVGISDDKNTEILSGLKSNEIVVISNQKKKVKKRSLKAK
jgi:multidrug efflux pump subunit AcrA (membrane-fusion protein)